VRKVNIGIIGCGNISGIYLKNLTSVFKNTNVVAVCDINEVAARRAAEEYKISKVYSDVKEFLADQDIELVLVLTTPLTHAQLCKAALEAGKHVYCEKPLSIDLESAAEVLALARSKGLRVGCAPDTFLGSGIQTSRKLIEEGWIGKPIGIRCNSIMYGPETWHPNPSFFYKKGAGPMLDLGPYYIACLTYLLDPVKNVKSYAKITHKQRVITSKERYGEIMDVEVPTYVSGLLEFEEDAIGSITITFDAFSSSGLGVEVLGTEGTLLVPNPDTFGEEDGSIQYKRLRKVKASLDTAEWAKIPNLYCYNENSRGVGVSDMASGILHGRKHRANGDFAFHALEVMLALANPNPEGVVKIESTFERLPGLPVGLALGEID
jgi:predicted dehydrogenase